MRRARPGRFAAHRGFTLIETLIVIVILGIAAAGIASLQSSIFSGQSDSRALLVGTQLMQECAEQVLATRRSSGYAAANSMTATESCSAMTLTDYTAPAVTVTEGNSATANMSACPTGSNCKLVEITQGGITPVTLLLVSY